MKCNLLLITLCTTLTLSMSHQVKAEITVETRKVRIQTSDDGINIRTNGRNINVSDDWDDYYFDPSYYSSGSNYQVIPYRRYRRNYLGDRCYQQNRQETRISGSSRRTVQTTVVNCD